MYKGISHTNTHACKKKKLAIASLPRDDEI